MGLMCSLLVSTYNWPEALELCLTSVLKQTVLPAEIIIADDGSTDDTRVLVAKYQSISPVPIKHIWHEDQGFRKCLILNKAIHQVSKDYIVQIDGDIILNRNFIEDHIAVAEKGCFVRGTRTLITEAMATEVLSNKKIDFHFYSKGLRNRFNAIRIPFLAGLLTKRLLSGANVRGCNMAYWKTDFIKVNGYNNDLQGWGHEDEELAIRLVNSGVLKKAIKWRCIQYHIHHKLASREQEFVHHQKLDAVRVKRLIECEFGYKESVF